MAGLQRVETYELFSWLDEDNANEYLTERWVYVPSLDTVEFAGYHEMAHFSLIYNLGIDPKNDGWYGGYVIPTKNWITIDWRPDVETFINDEGVIAKVEAALSTTHTAAQIDVELPWGLTHGYRPYIQVDDGNTYVADKASGHSILLGVLRQQLSPDDYLDVSEAYHSGQYGYVNPEGQFEKSSMADRSGNPEVDALIEEFLRTPQGDWTTDTEPYEALRNPANAHGNCQSVTEHFVEFAKAKGFQAYVTDTDVKEMGYTPTGQGGEIGFNDQNEMQYGFYPEHTIATIVVNDPAYKFGREFYIDFTASQYGYTDHPKVTSKISGWEIMPNENETVIVNPINYHFTPLTEVELNSWHDLSPKQQGWWLAKALKLTKDANSRGAIGKVSGQQLYAITFRFGGNCAYDGQPGASSFDHVIPVSQGGTNTIDNLLPIHVKCNSEMNDWDYQHYRRFDPGSYTLPDDVPNEFKTSIVDWHQLTIQCYGLAHALDAQIYWDGDFDAPLEGGAYGPGNIFAEFDEDLDENGDYYVVETRLHCPPIRDTRSYYVTLHEIGHAAFTRQYGPDSDQSVEEELWVNHYALEHAVIPIPMDVLQMAQESLQTYENNKHVSEPSDANPGWLKDYPRQSALTPYRKFLYDPDSQEFHVWDVEGSDGYPSHTQFVYEQHPEYRPQMYDQPCGWIDPDGEMGVYPDWGDYDDQFRALDLAQEYVKAHSTEYPPIWQHHSAEDDRIWMKWIYNADTDEVKYRTVLYGDTHPMWAYSLGWDKSKWYGGYFDLTNGIVQSLDEFWPAMEPGDRELLDHIKQKIEEGINKSSSWKLSAPDPDVRWLYYPPTGQLMIGDANGTVHPMLAFSLKVPLDQSVGGFAYYNRRGDVTNPEIEFLPGNRQINIVDPQSVDADEAGQYLANVDNLFRTRKYEIFTMGRRSSTISMPEDWHFDQLIRPDIFNDIYNAPQTGMVEQNYPNKSTSYIFNEINRWLVNSSPWKTHSSSYTSGWKLSDWMDWDNAVPFLYDGKDVYYGKPEDGGHLEWFHRLRKDDPDLGKYLNTAYPASHTGWIDPNNEIDGFDTKGLPEGLVQYPHTSKWTAVQINVKLIKVPRPQQDSGWSFIYNANNNTLYLGSEQSDHMPMIRAADPQDAQAMTEAYGRGRTSDAAIGVVAPNGKITYYADDGNYQPLIDPMLNSMLGGFYRNPNMQPPKFYSGWKISWKFDPRVALPTAYRWIYNADTQQLAVFPAREGTHSQWSFKNNFPYEAESYAGFYSSDDGFEVITHKDNDPLLPNIKSLVEQRLEEINKTSVSEGEALRWAWHPSTGLEVWPYHEKEHRDWANENGFESEGDFAGGTIIDNKSDDYHSTDEQMANGGQQAIKEAYPDVEHRIFPIEQSQMMYERGLNYNPLDNSSDSQSPKWYKKLLGQIPVSMPADEPLQPEEAEMLQNQLVDLASKNNALIEFKDMSWVQAAGKRNLEIGSPMLIYTPLLKGTWEYLVALHEIGHAAFFQTYGGEGGMNPHRPNSYEQELWADHFILENSLIPFSPEMLAFKQNVLNSYHSPKYHYIDPTENVNWIQPKQEQITFTPDRDVSYYDAYRPDYSLDWAHRVDLNQRFKNKEFPFQQQSSWSKIGTTVVKIEDMDKHHNSLTFVYDVNTDTLYWAWGVMHAQLKYKIEADGYPFSDDNTTVSGWMNGVSNRVNNYGLDPLPGNIQQIVKGLMTGHTSAISSDTKIIDVTSEVKSDPTTPYVKWIWSDDQDALYYWHVDSHDGEPWHTHVMYQLWNKTYGARGFDYGSGSFHGGKWDTDDPELTEYLNSDPQTVGQDISKGGKWKIDQNGVHLDGIVSTDIWMNPRAWVYDVDDDKLYAGAGHPTIVYNHPELRNHKCIYGLFGAGDPYIFSDTGASYYESTAREKAIERAREYVQESGGYLSQGLGHTLTDSSQENGEENQEQDDRIGQDSRQNLSHPVHHMSSQVAPYTGNRVDWAQILDEFNSVPINSPYNNYINNIKSAIKSNWNWTHRIPNSLGSSRYESLDLSQSLPNSSWTLHSSPLNNPDIRSPFRYIVDNNNNVLLDTDYQAHWPYITHGSMVYEAGLDPSYWKYHYGYIKDYQALPCEHCWNDRLEQHGDSAEVEALVQARVDQAFSSATRTASHGQVPPPSIVEDSYMHVGRKHLSALASIQNISKWTIDEPLLNLSDNDFVFSGAENLSDLSKRALEPHTKTSLDDQGQPNPYDDSQAFIYQDGRIYWGDDDLPATTHPHIIYHYGLDRSKPMVPGWINYPGKMIAFESHEEEVNPTLISEAKSALDQIYPEFQAFRISDIYETLAPSDRYGWKMSSIPFIGPKDSESLIEYKGMIFGDKSHAAALYRARDYTGDDIEDILDNGLAGYYQGTPEIHWDRMNLREYLNWDHLGPEAHVSGEELADQNHDTSVPYIYTGGKAFVGDYLNGTHAMLFYRHPERHELDSLYRLYEQTTKQPWWSTNLTMDHWIGRFYPETGELVDWTDNEVPQRVKNAVTHAYARGLLTESHKESMTSSYISFVWTPESGFIWGHQEEEYEGEEAPNETHPEILYRTGIKPDHPNLVTGWMDQGRKNYMFHSFEEYQSNKNRVGQAMVRKLFAKEFPDYHEVMPTQFIWKETSDQPALFDPSNPPSITWVDPTQHEELQRPYTNYDAIGQPISWTPAGRYKGLWYPTLNSVTMWPTDVEGWPHHSHLIYGLRREDQWKDSMQLIEGDSNHLDSWNPKWNPELGNWLTQQIQARGQKRSIIDGDVDVDNNEAFVYALDGIGDGELYLGKDQPGLLGLTHPDIMYHHGIGDPFLAGWLDHKHKVYAFYSVEKGRGQDFELWDGATDALQERFPGYTEYPYPSSIFSLSGNSWVLA